MNINPIAYIISVIVLVVCAICSSVFDKTAIVAIASVIVILLPAIYSVIPLIENARLARNNKKNRMSEDTFTDRVEDLTNILNRLSNPGHIIEITSNANQEGKTWLAKKLYDSINRLNSDDNSVNKKCPYRKAYYLDMDNKHDEYIHEFFQKTYITEKDVLIFDHVENLNLLLTKQGDYGFQMIYIMKEGSQTNPSCHKVSTFERENIKKLHTKIKNRHSGISDITQEEANILYDLTGGNIGKIAAILHRAEYVDWLVDKAKGDYTAYEKELHRIEVELFCGNYRTAEAALVVFEEQNTKALTLNNDMRFKYLMIKSDCKHLLNKYDEALAILSTADPTYDTQYALELHEAHYLKHLWRCNDAISMLQIIYDYSLAAITDTFGILAAKYFINDLYVPNSSRNSLEEFLSLHRIAEQSTLPCNHKSKNKLKTYKVVYDYYNNRPEEERGLIEQINEVIKIYSDENNRLLANAYFLRGEIYRLYKKYDLAEKDYKRTLMYTDDNNIKIQVGIIRYYLALTHNRAFEKSNFDMELQKKEITMLCAGKNRYGELLLHDINCIELDDPPQNNIIERIDSRIMVIL